MGKEIKTYPYDCPNIVELGWKPQFGMCPFVELSDVLKFELDFYQRRLGNGVYWELENGEEYY